MVLLSSDGSGETNVPPPSTLSPQTTHWLRAEPLRRGHGPLHRRPGTAPEGLAVPHSWLSQAVPERVRPDAAHAHRYRVSSCSPGSTTRTCWSCAVICWPTAGRPTGSPAWSASM
ncbi:hypothetical protein MRX96_020970 [Rhipicephalus microplus]